MKISDFVSHPHEQPSETLKESKEVEVPEVRVDSNGNHNNFPDGAKKKLNKRERKEARQQKNGRSVKGADETAAQEPEENPAGKKKDKKRRRGFEEDRDDEKNGVEMSSKKKKTSKAISKCHELMDVVLLI